MKEMRRSSQKMTETEILNILDRNTNGVLSVYSDDYPYAVPISYVRIENKLYFHSAKSGQKIEAIQKDHRVSFCIVDEDTIVPEEFTTYYRSAIVYGKAIIVEDEKERIQAFYALADKYSKEIAQKMKDEEVLKGASQALIIRIDIEEMFGKKAKEYV